MSEVGRPTSYVARYAEQTYKLCLLGATDSELADFFGVCVDTIHEWKKVHPEFSDSIKSGKREADANVANRLYNRALGYSHKAVKIFMPANAEEPVYADYTEQYPPDTAAAIFWLKNRQPAKWRDKIETENKTTIEFDQAKADVRIAELLQKAGLSEDQVQAALNAK